MRHKLLSVLTILHCALLMLALMWIPSAILFPQDTVRYLRCLIVILPAALSQTAIHKCRHLSIYLLTGIAASVLCFLLADGLCEKIVFPAAAALCFLPRIPARLQGTEDFFCLPGIFFLILFAVTYIISCFLDLGKYGTFVYFAAFAYLILIILYTNVSGVDSYLQQNREIANLPGRQILSTNRLLLSLFLAVVLIAMLILPALGLQNAIRDLGDLLGKLIRFLFSLLPQHAEEEVIETTQAVTEAAQDMSALAGENTTPAWLTMLYTILEYFFGGVICIGALILAGLGIISLFKRFYQPIRENNDEQEFIPEEEPDQSARAGHTAKEKSLFFSFDPNSQIRKLWKKRIRKGYHSHGIKEEAIPSSATPSELEKEAALAEEEQAALLHALYEKARYSNEKCSAFELEQIKKGKAAKK